MARKNVINLLNELDSLIDDYGEVYLEKAFYTPSYLVPLTTYLYFEKVPYNKFDLDPYNLSYLKTIGFYRQLWGKVDGYQRLKNGHTYASIACLDSPEHVNQVNTEISSCLTKLVGEQRSEGFLKLIDVIGEVHDNVWAHGCSTGFSMAQTYEDPITHKKFIEFTLADQGRGFLREVKSVGLSISSHKDAIEWCIQKGNSTKLVTADDWRQRVPGDFVGNNPMGRFGGQIRESHHQGYGLFHLIDLVENFNGELYLISGNAALHIKNKKRAYLRLKNEWQGVIISCRFDRDELLSSDIGKPVDDEKLSNIIRRLRGD
ncbi:hypothetical protein [Acinetobacter thermotolerans]|uniref:hypothetical protein n=1 Tax=Acinetobacter thermotolerans TaxID=3151487 RepID=UPI00325B828E